MQLLDSCPLPQAQFASISILLQLHLPNEEGNNDSGANTSDGDSHHPTILENVSSEDLETAAADGIRKNNPPSGDGGAPEVEMIECKTSAGGTKLVPRYPKGMVVYYKNARRPGNDGAQKTPATILDVHLDDLLEPYYTVRLEDGREKQTDNAHLRLDPSPTDETTDEEDGSVACDDDEDEDGQEEAGAEADESAGPPPPTMPRGRTLRFAVLEESLAVVTPLTSLPEGACRRSLDGLHRRAMEEFNMRDDFAGIGQHDDDDDDNGQVDKESGDVHDEKGGRAMREDDDADDEMKVRREGSRVRFQDDTKEGAREDLSVSVASKDRNPTVPLGSMLPVKIYQPPPHVLNCSLGLTMFYTAVYVEDVSRVSSEERKGSKIEKDSMQAFYNCASVLLPGMPLSDLTNSINGLDGGKKQRQSGGVILLAVGTTGPAYDIFGASSVTATLPERLRGGMSTLVRLDTTPKEVQTVAAVSNLQPQLPQGGSQRKKKSKGKNGTPTNAAAAAEAAQPPPQKTTYDAAYFKRIYAALLAALIDDEDGLARDHDEIVPPTAADGELFSSTAAVVGSYVPSRSQQRRPPPFLNGLTNQSVTSSGTAKRKLFTFSRKKSNKSKNGDMAYESGELISGGELAPDNVAVGGSSVRPAEDGTGANNAEIVRRTAQRLEVLSLAEDDMDLPKYTRAVEGGRGGNGTSRRSRESPRSLESPRRMSKASGYHNAGSSSGRFGRQPVPSDLAGFEYRPPRSRPHHLILGGTSSGGTVATSTTGASSFADDGSVQTGDDAATVATMGSKYTVASQSSNVPMLSKSKRDGSKTTTGTSRLRFLRRKKKENKSLADLASPPKTMPETVHEEASAAGQHPQSGQAKNKPPLFPQQQQSPPLQQQQVYNPFSFDEEDELHDHEQQADMKTIEGQSSMGSLSIASMPTSKDNAARTPSVLIPEAGIVEPPTHPAATSEEQLSAAPSPAPQAAIEPPQSVASDTIIRSYSEESARTEESRQSEAASIGTESAASITTENEEASIQQVGSPAPTEEAESAEPTRHLEVGLAMNEDLTCEYKRSKLSSLSVEGTVQVRVKSRYDDAHAPRQHQQPPVIPFFLAFQDHSGHIKALQENKKFVENVTHEQGDAIANREFTYTIKVPREEEYFPVVRYKCGNSLRPVPIRVQCRVRIQGKHVRIALQISSNPQNPSDLTYLTIIMSVPPGVRGDSLQCNPPGGVWNESKRVVLWCVSELGGGEKFQLQSIFEIEEELLDGSESEEDLAEKLEFPVLSRCQCSGAQLSDAALEVSGVGSDIFPAEISTTVVRRFRVSHKESNL